MKTSKIKNSLKKGRLIVDYADEEFQVVEVYTKRARLLGKDGTTLTASTSDITFNKFEKH